MQPSKQTSTLVAVSRVLPTCGVCCERPAITPYKKRWLVMKDHDMCRQCWRSAMDRSAATWRARHALGRRATATRGAPPEPWIAGVALDATRR